MDLTRWNRHRPHDSQAWNLLSDGTQTQVTEDFKLYEYQCNDGTPILLIHPALSEMLQSLRDHFGVPVELNSAFRTYAYNDTIEGSAEQSRHLWGMAADPVVQGVPPREVTNWAEAHDVGGIGYYHDFTHLDVQGRNRRWGPRWE